LASACAYDNFFPQGPTEGAGPPNVNLGPP